MTLLRTLSAAPLEAMPPSRSRIAVPRLVAALALLASSAVLLRWSSIDDDERKRSLKLYDPLITNLADVVGTTTAAEAIAKATTAGRIASAATVADAVAAVRGGFADGSPPVAESVTPVYWHIYKAGGTAVKNVLTQCLDLTVASNVGVLKGHDKDAEIGVMRLGGHNYVNVDTVGRDGIERASTMGLARSGLADAVVSPIIHKSIADIFSPRHQAMIFTVFRHPVDRLVSQYFYLQDADWEKTYDPNIAKESLGHYAKKFDNRMMRQLTGKDIAPVPLTEADLDLAKETVRTKMIVGLQSDVEGSVRRFVRYFGWQRPDGNAEEFERCMGEEFSTKAKEHGAKTDNNRHKHPTIVEGSEEWKAVAEVNEWDLRLYDYVLQIYEEQGKLLDPAAPMEKAASANEVTRAAADSTPLIAASASNVADEARAAARVAAAATVAEKVARLSAK